MINPGVDSKASIFLNQLFSKTCYTKKLNRKKELFLTKKV